MKFTRLAAVAALVASVSADFEIFSPSSEVWWVAKSLNTLSWSCNDPAALAHPTFVIQVANSDPKILAAPLAILSIENNFDCSKTINADALTMGPAKGYTVLLVNPLNSTDVFVTSEPFEIKPLGSTYPTATPGIDAASSSGSAGASPTATGSTGGSSPSSKPNGAVGMGVKAAGIVSAAAGVLGLVL